MSIRFFYSITPPPVYHAVPDESGESPPPDFTQERPSFDDDDDATEDGPSNIEDQSPDGDEIPGMCFVLSSGDGSLLVQNEDSHFS